MRLDDFKCHCGNSLVELSADSSVCDSGAWSAKCRSCNRHKTGSSILSLYAEWNDLIPARYAADCIFMAIKQISQSLTNKEQKSTDLLSNIPDKLAGRRAMAILQESGMMSVRFIVDDEEVDIKGASTAKSSGKEVTTMCKISSPFQN